MVGGSLYRNTVLFDLLDNPRSSNPFSNDESQKTVLIMPFPSVTMDAYLTKSRIDGT